MNVNLVLPCFIESIERGKKVSGEDNCFYSTSQGKYEINMASIATKLIQEAGRWCDSYASDFLIDWRQIENLLESGEEEFDEVFFFGIRQCGVDHYNFILYRNINNVSSDYYSRIYALRMKAENERLNVKLVDIKNSLIYRPELPKEIKIYKQDGCIKISLEEENGKRSGTIEKEDGTFITVKEIDGDITFSGKKTKKIAVIHWGNDENGDTNVLCVKNVNDVNAAENEIKNLL